MLFSSQVICTWLKRQFQSFHTCQSTFFCQTFKSLHTHMSEPFMPQFGRGVFSESINTPITNFDFYHIKNAYFLASGYYQGTFFPLPFLVPKHTCIPFFAQNSGGYQIQMHVRDMPHIFQCQVITNVCFQTNISFYHNFGCITIPHSYMTKIITYIGGKEISS